MKTTTKYLCEICGIEHPTPALAEQCAALGYPENTSKIQEGDIVNFQREERGEGASSLITYIVESGKVIYKFTVFNSKQNAHQDVMICEVENEKDGKHERGVLMVNIGSEGEQLFSPNDYAFKTGMAEFMIECKKAEENKSP